MTKVVVKNGNIDGALKRFKQVVAKSGIPSECKKENIILNLVFKEEKLKKLALKIVEKNKVVIETNLSS